MPRRGRLGHDGRRQHQPLRAAHPFEHVFRRFAHADARLTAIPMPSEPLPPSAPVPAEAAATLWCFEHFLSGIAVLLVGIVLALAAADPVAVFGVPMLLAAVWMVAITSKRMPRRGQGSADRLDGLLSRHATWLEHMVSEWRDTGVPDWCYDTDQAAAERIQQEILRRVQSGQLAVEVSDSSISLAEPADADTARTGLSLASDEAEPLPRLTGVEDSQSVGREELDAG